MAEMSTLPCECCKLRYAKWKVQYFGDPQQRKFCINCYNEHQVSPSGNGRERSYKEDLNPAYQYFSVSCSKIERFNLKPYIHVHAHKPCTDRERPRLQMLYLHSGTDPSDKGRWPSRALLYRMCSATSQFSDDDQLKTGSSVPATAIRQPKIENSDTLNNTSKTFTIFINIYVQLYQFVFVPAQFMHFYSFVIDIMLTSRTVNRLITLCACT